MRSRRGVRAALCLVPLLVGAVACGGDDTATTGDVDLGDPGDCLIVDLAVSPEKIDLLTSLAKTFNAQRQLVGERCIFARPQRKASGAAASLLATDWDESTNGPRPVIWSPAASAWGAVVNQRLTSAGKPAIAPENPTPFMVTPLVIAMPEPMAAALGYPQKPVGWKDILSLATDPNGWATYGHPEWGPFRLGKTNPNFSTSGLHALIAQTYAATGKTRDLTSEDLANPEVQAFGKDIESAVVHYGDTTLNFLNNWYRADRKGTALTYTSAVAVEEKSVIDYNAGNPDGILDAGEVATPPATRLVAIYPSEGTLYSDSPFFILEAPWVTAEQKAAAETFQRFVQEPANQENALKFGFRPGNPAVPVKDPIVAANGVDPTQPTTLLQVPRPEIMIGMLDQWSANRKLARVMLVLDVSGSMGNAGDAAGRETKLDLAKRATTTALAQFKDEDRVGLRIFSTKLGPGGNQNFLDLVPVSPIGTNREELPQRINALTPVSGTPLYEVTGSSYQQMLDDYDPASINAVILLTDGRNEDGDSSDDSAQLNALLNAIRSGSTGENARPVRVFTISYGEDADPAVLKQIAEASDAVAYDASDATRIDQVFANVISNF